MIKEYKNADALLFLSSEESLGLPLIEAMAINIPIVCPNLDYSRNICGDSAFYFDLNNLDSLYDTLKALKII